MELFVPGRICLFGEHSDWAGGYRRSNEALDKGYTLICGTNQGLYATVRPHPSALVMTATMPDGEVRGPHILPMEPEALLSEARRGTFWSYMAGVAFQILSRNGPSEPSSRPVGGLVIDNYRTDLPIKKGLSSSAAVSVLTARAWNRIYDLGLTIRDEMELAYLGEVTTPSRCGRMDQGCAFGSRPVLMTFDGDQLDTEELMVGRDLHLVIVDLGAGKDTMKILSDLNRCYPVARSKIDLGVQHLLGPVNRRIVQRAMEALRLGDARRIGALMVEAQACFDRFAAPVCPEQLAAPELHRLLAYEPLRTHTWGGKGVGSQGDGSAQLVARSPEDQQAAVEIIERDLGMQCLKLTIGANHTPPETVALPGGMLREHGLE